MLKKPEDEWSGFAATVESRFRRLAEKDIRRANAARRKLNEILDEAIEEMIG